MKLTPFIAAAILAYGAAADEAQKPLSDESSSAAESATSSVDASMPTFTVSSESSSLIDAPRGHLATSMSSALHPVTHSCPNIAAKNKSARSVN